MLKDQVEVFENADEVEFSIMHGSLFRRQRIVENGRFGFHSFWPVQSASAIYNREFGELRINAKTGKEKALYCRLLGKHMFGNENLFPTGIKYTLDPLREFEFDALAPGGIEGITDVRMIELWLGDPDDRYGVITIRKGDDLLNWLRRKRKTFGWNVALFRQPSRWSSKEERPNWRSRSVLPTLQSTVVEEYPRPSKLGLPSALYYLEASTKEDAS